MAGSSPPADPRSLLSRHARRVLRQLVTTYPTVVCGLEYRNAFELLVATVLSAQCTDVRVNLVTPRLFARFPDPESMAEARLAEVEELIYSTGFFRAKARHLLNLSAILVKQHAGIVPARLADLTALPGVGRKTAHVVLGNAFRITSGVVVDTHVNRLSRRLGLTKRADPVHVEADLVALIPRRHWIDLSHRLIAHGRQTCVAIRPRCGECALSSLCPKVGLPAAVGPSP